MTQPSIVSTLLEERVQGEDHDEEVIKNIAALAYLGMSQIRPIETGTENRWTAGVDTVRGPSHLNSSMCLIAHIT